MPRQLPIAARTAILGLMYYTAKGLPREPEELLKIAYHDTDDDDFMLAETEESVNPNLASLPETFTCSCSQMIHIPTFPGVLYPVCLDLSYSGGIVGGKEESTTNSSARSFFNQAIGVLFKEIGTDAGLVQSNAKDVQHGFFRVEARNIYSTPFSRQFIFNPIDTDKVLDTLQGLYREAEILFAHEKALNPIDQAARNLHLPKHDSSRER